MERYGQCQYWRSTEERDEPEAVFSLSLFFCLLALTFPSAKYSELRSEFVSA